MKTKVAILGSTGSIGSNTLDVISRMPGKFTVVGLSAGSNIELLAQQAHKFRPTAICIADERARSGLKRLAPSGTLITSGGEGLREMVSGGGVDIIVLAITGTDCLGPLIDAVRAGKRIALANKEALISAGPIINSLALKSGAKIIPVDSEHSAIFQCLEGRARQLSRIFLTGSGGPLLNVSADRFDSLKKSDILNHPKWKMGEKITIDSATMMNKGLEIIEAQYLFGLDESKIEVLVHPEAIVHSMIELTDGAVIAQLAQPDMRMPIQYALTYPDRGPAIVKSVDFSSIGSLTFRRPDSRKFPCLELARKTARAGGLAPVILCAADEAAVNAYLEGSIKFSEIPEIVGNILERGKTLAKKHPSIEEVLKAAQWAKEEAKEICYH